MASKLNADLPKLTALDLEKHVDVPTAAEIKGVSETTFKRHYAHIITKISTRREAVKLRALLTAQPTASTYVNPKRRVHA
jgi:hypothetical protein